MKDLRFITLTGADDSVSPKQLAEISLEFPFVEWGILLGSGEGIRFPSIDWINELIELQIDSHHAMNLSLHICGKYLRGIATSLPTPQDGLGPGLLAFQRCQLNWHGEKWRSIEEHILSSFCRMFPWEPEIIFQLDGINDQLMTAASRRFLCSGLFDLSHGAGILPDQWSDARYDIACGWAGGIGPENVIDCLDSIAKKAKQPFWIDMETKLFTGDQFDLTKCRAVLEQVSKHQAINR